MQNSEPTSETKASKNPKIFAQEMVDDLEAALEQCREIAVDLTADTLTEKDRESSKL